MSTTSPIGSSTPASSANFGNQSPVSFGGLVSGLSTQQIIQALTQAYQAPIKLLQSQQAAEQAKLAAYQDLNTKINMLQSAASSLSLQATIGAKQVTFGGPSGTYATGTALTTAVNGSFTLEIDSLASPTTVTSTSGIGVPVVATGQVIGSNTSTPITAGSFSVDGHAINVSVGETFQQVFNDINTATGGSVTASIVGNKIQLSSTSAITLGSGGDTSNFLSVTKLAGQPSGTTLTSTGPVGVSNPNVSLDSASINGLTSTTTGTLNINGATITYNTTTDTLNTVINRINASSAGVTASYDPNADQITLTSRSTGNLDVSVADINGNLASSLNITSAAAHHLGQSASYKVNGGTTQYSLSDTVQNIVPGVNVTLSATTPSGNPLSVSVGQDLKSAESSIKTFVTAYNSVIDTIATDTAYNSQTKQAGVLFGDSTVAAIQAQLNSGLFISNGQALGLTPPYTDVSTIGLSTGPIGSPIGTTTDLQFNSSTFETAMNTNPAAVSNLVTTIFNKFNTMTMNLTQPGGVVDSAVQGENNLINDYNQQITFQNDLLRQQVAFYNQEFTALETTLAQLQTSSAIGASTLAALSTVGTTGTPTTTGTTPAATAAAGG